MDIKNIKEEWNTTILDILKTFISICTSSILTAAQAPMV